MQRLALNLPRSQVFCSERWWFSLGARAALEGPSGGTAPWNAEEHPAHHPRVPEHRDFTQVGLTGTFPHTALREELIDFLLKV